MKSILISHSNRPNEPDLPISLELYNYLSERKIDSWIDAKLKIGNWKKQIGIVMLETPIVIFVASRHSMASEEVMGEVGYFRETEGKFVVPFVIDKQYYLNIDKDAPEAVYVFGANKYQAVFLENYATHEEAFERLLQLLPADITRLDNNPADFDYENASDAVLTEYHGSDSCVTIPPYVKEIGKEAFMFNDTLTKVIIPPSVQKIGERAFYGCSQLIEVEGMDGLIEIESSAFDESGVAPNKQNGYVFHDIIFGGGGQKTLTIPDGVKIVANEAFRYCEAEQIILPQSLVSIGAVAFADSLFLKRLQIPSSVERIGKNAFRGCSRLAKVIFDGKVPNDASEGFDNLQKLIDAEDK